MAEPVQRELLEAFGGGGGAAAAAEDASDALEAGRGGGADDAAEDASDASDASDDGLTADEIERSRRIMTELLAHAAGCDGCDARDCARMRSFIEHRRKCEVPGFHGPRGNCF